MCHLSNAVVSMVKHPINPSSNIPATQIYRFMRPSTQFLEQSDDLDVDRYLPSVNRTKWSPKQL